MQALELRVSILRRPNSETYLTLLTKTEGQRERIYNMLNGLGTEELIDTTRFTAFIGDSSYTLLLIELSAGDDHDEIIALIAEQCLKRLALKLKIYETTDESAYTKMRGWAQGSLAQELNEN